MPSPFLRPASIAFLAAAFLTAAPNAPAEAQNRRGSSAGDISVTVTNRSSESLNNLYVTPADSPAWGADRLGDETVARGSRHSLKVPRTAGCRYDIRAVYAGGSVDIETDINLCASGAVALTGGKGVSALRLVRLAARRPVGLFLVQNRTGAEILNLFAGETDVIEGTTVDPGDQTVGRFRHADGCRLDLAAEIKEGDPIFLKGYDLCAMPVVTLQPQEQGTPIRVRNRSAYPVSQIFVRPAGFPVWGPDRLGANILSPRDMKTIRVATSGGLCAHDIKVVFSAADDEIRSGVDLCAAGSHDIEGPELVTGRGDRKAAAAPAPTRQTLNVTIRNESSRTIREVFISPASSKDWGDNLLPQPVARAGSAALALQQDDSCLFDIKAVYEGGREQRRMNHDLCRASTVAIGGTLAKLIDGGGPETGFPVRFSNVGRSQIQTIFLTPSSDTHWGEDRLGSNALERDSRLDLRLPRAGGCFWDLKVTFSQETTPLETRRLNLCDQPDQQLRQKQKPGTVVTTGTGFYVSAAGHVVTNSHVVEGCRVVQVARDGQPPLPLRLLRDDADIDVAVLKADSGETPFITLRDASAQPTLTGEKAIVVGYPVRNKLGVVNVTEGIVSSAGGPGQDPSRLQLTAPVQPGNSGGPILDAAGRAIGVVVSRLNQIDDERMAQNVNFGVSGAAVQAFLREAGVAIPDADRTAPDRATPEVFQRVNAAVLPLDCLE